MGSDRRSGRGTGLILLLAALLAAPATAQITRLASPDTTRGNYFGAALSTDGIRAVVGASGVATCGPNAGAAYVYARSDDGSWELEATLVPDDCADDVYFGRAVAVDGDVAAVTAYVPGFSARSNAVYVFERSLDGSWRQTGRITRPGSDGPFAASVSLHGGRILVTSAGDTGRGTHQGAAHLYAPNAVGRWVEAAALPLPADAEGVFGASCALHGRTAVVTSSTYGREKAGAATVYRERPDGTWQVEQVVHDVDAYFMPVALDAGRLLVGETRGGRRGTGRARLFERGLAGWSQRAVLQPSAPYPSGGFGSHVALDGGHALVVGFDEQLQFDFNIDRVVYVFGRGDDGGWVQRHIIDVGEVYFGTAVALRGGTAFVGEASDVAPGAVYAVTVR